MITFEQLPAAVERLEQKMDALISHVANLMKTEVPVKEKEILFIAEAVELIGLAESTIYSKVCKKEIPHSKKGGRLRFKRSELLAWMDEGKVQTIDEIHQEIAADAHKMNRKKLQR